MVACFQRICNAVPATKPCNAALLTITLSGNTYACVWRRCFRHLHQTWQGWPAAGQHLSCISMSGSFKAQSASGHWPSRSAAPSVVDPNQKYQNFENVEQNAAHLAHHSHGWDEALYSANPLGGAKGKWVQGVHSKLSYQGCKTQWQLHPKSCLPQKHHPMDFVDHDDFGFVQILRRCHNGVVLKMRRTTTIMMRWQCQKDAQERPPTGSSGE